MVTAATPASAPASARPAPKPSVARARRQAAGDGFEHGELSLGALRLPPDLHTALRAAIRACDTLLRHSPSADLALAADVAEAVAIDIAVLAHNLAGRPRSVDMMRLLVTLEAAIAALTAAYRTARSGKESA